MLAHKRPWDQEQAKHNVTTPSSESKQKCALSKFDKVRDPSMKSIGLVRFKLELNQDQS